MKKYLFISVLALTLSFNLKAQTWFPLGNNWNLGITAMDTLGGDIYASGDTWCNDTTTLHNCYSYMKGWNGAKWDTLLTFGGLPPDVNTITAYNDSIYFSGGFSSGVYKLTGKTVVTIDGNADVAVLLPFSGSLCSGGQFTSIDGVSANSIALWNGTTWSPLGKGINNTVYSLTVYSGKLVAGGTFDSAGGIHANNIAIWNGTTWDSIGHGLNGIVNVLTTYNGNLYVGGIFDSAGGVSANNIAEWNGTTWLPLGAGISGIYGVNAFTIYNSNLIIGGMFDSAGGKPANNIAQWNGTSWNTIGNGVNGGVRALTVYDSFLCAAGFFDSAGGKPITDIAGWCISCPAGVNELHAESEKVKVYPNPNNGQFFINSSSLPGTKQSLQVYSMLGQKIFTQYILPNTQNSVDLSSQPAGIYLYRITSEKGELVGSGKLVIE